MIKPQRDIVLVKADKANNQTKSGILISEEWVSHPLTGTIEALGPEVVGLQVGDRILFERYSSIILEDDLRLIQAKLVFAVVNDETA